jgi:hypothetical protein
VRFLGTCEIRGSGEDGISITYGSSALFSAERDTTAENARGGILVIGTSTAAFDTGTVHTTQNTWGILTLGHSSLTLGRNMPTILAEHNTLDGILVADTLRPPAWWDDHCRPEWACRVMVCKAGHRQYWDDSAREQYRGGESRDYLSHCPADCREHDHPGQYHWH